MNTETEERFIEFEYGHGRKVYTARIWMWLTVLKSQNMEMASKIEGEKNGKQFTQ